MGIASRADIAAMEDEPVMGRWDVCRWDVAGELLLNGIGGCGAVGNEPKTMADAKDVSINSHCGLVPHYSLHDVGSLTSHAWELDEFLKRLRYLAAETLHQHVRHTHKVSSFAVGVRDAFNIRENVFGCG